VQYVTRPCQVQTSVVKKSAAAMLPQCAFKNVCQGVGRRHPHDQAPDLDEDVAPAGLPSVRPFPRNQPAMPPQQRVRRRDCGDLPEDRPAHPVRTGGQLAAIVVSQAQPPRPKLAPQEPVFLDQVGDRLPLPALEPTGQHAQHHLQRRGVDHGVEPISIGGSERRRRSGGTLRA
jgi:hypothetical protein